MTRYVSYECPFCEVSLADAVPRGDCYWDTFECPGCGALCAHAHEGDEYLVRHDLAEEGGDAERSKSIGPVDSTFDEREEGQEPDPDTEIRVYLVCLPKATTVE